MVKIINGTVADSRKFIVNGHTVKSFVYMCVVQYCRQAVNRIQFQNQIFVFNFGVSWPVI